MDQQFTLVFPDECAKDLKHLADAIYTGKLNLGNEALKLLMKSLNIEKFHFMPLQWSSIELKSEGKKWPIMR